MDLGACKTLCMEGGCNYLRSLDVEDEAPLIKSQGRPTSEDKYLVLAS